MEYKIKITSNIKELRIEQKRELDNSIGEFLARVMLDKTRKSEQFDIRHVQHTLKLNQ